MQKQKNKHYIDEWQPWDGGQMTAVLPRNAITQVDDMTMLIPRMGRVVRIEIVVMARMGVRDGRVMTQVRMRTSERCQHQIDAQAKAQKAHEEAHY